MAPPVFDPSQDDEPTCGVCGGDMHLEPHCSPDARPSLAYVCRHCSDAADAHQSFIDHERNLDLLEKD